MDISPQTVARINAALFGRTEQPTDDQALLHALLEHYDFHRVALGIQADDFRKVFKGVSGRIALRQAILDLERFAPLYTNPTVLEMAWNKISPNRQMAIHSLLAFFDDFKEKRSGDSSLEQVFNQKADGGFMRSSHTRQTYLREQALIFFGSERKGRGAALETTEAAIFEHKGMSAAELNRLVVTIKKLRATDPIKTQEIILALEGRFDDVFPKMQERLLDKYTSPYIPAARAIAILTATRTHLQERVEKGLVPKETGPAQAAGSSSPALAS